MQHLQSLRDEFNFANTAATEFDVAIDFATFDDFVFDALFDGGDFVQGAFADGTGVAKGRRLDRRPPLVGGMRG